MGLVVLLLGAGAFAWWARKEPGETPSDVEDGPDREAFELPALDFAMDRRAVEVPRTPRCPTDPEQMPPEPATDRLQGVVRGCVGLRGGGPLADVRVLLDDVEVARANAAGLYAAVVPTEGPVWLEFELEGHLPAYRRIEATPGRATWVDDVALVPQDATATEIDFSAPIEVARGSVASDEHGSRQATLLFPQGARPEMVLPSGERRALSSVTVRATEYTVGGDGEVAMPAPLPPTSAYTYAVELSIDEARAAGATEVAFQTPVAYYVENFLGFAVGTVVPVGSLDPQAGEWEPSANGLVVGVVDAGGSPGLDLRGDGRAANASQLAALGVTDAELREVARLYAPGTTLWRAPLSHFSIFDLNWPWGADNATAPEGEPGQPSCDPCSRPGGSVLEMQTQVLRESVATPGIPGGLHYRSDRTPGHDASYRVHVPLGGPDVPRNVKRVEITVEVAGVRIEKEFRPESGKEWVFAWDGRNATGERVEGPVPITIRRSYAYEAVYREPGERTVAWEEVGTKVTLVPARGEIAYSSTWHGSIGAWDAREVGLGGWTLGMHHRLDPAGGALYMGDGTRRDVVPIESVLRTLPVAAPPREALGASMRPVAVAFGASGELAIAEPDRIHGLLPDGTLVHLAGSAPRPGTPEELLELGIPAVVARLHDVADVAYHPDGSLLVAERGAHRITRIDAEGSLVPFAGDGTAGVRGDGGPAATARLDRPERLAVSSDGAVHVVVGGGAEVRRIDPQGIISRVPLGPFRDPILDLSVSPEGDLHVVSGPGVWRALPNGSSVLVAGDGREIGIPEIGAEATKTRIWPKAVVAGPSGRVAFAQGSSSVLEVGPDGRLRESLGPAPSGEDPIVGISSLALDLDGRLHAADAMRVLRVDANGRASRIAGESRFGGGEAFAWPDLRGATGMAVMPDGAVLLAFGKPYVDRIDPTGRVTRFAGMATAGFSGDGGPATAAALSSVTDVVVAKDGTVYLADKDNARVRRVSPEGIITSYIGSGAKASSYEPGPLSAAIPPVDGVALDPEGALYLSTFGVGVAMVAPNGTLQPAGDPRVTATLARIEVGNDGRIFGLTRPIAHCGAIVEVVRAVFLIQGGGTAPPFLDLDPGGGDRVDCRRDPGYADLLADPDGSVHFLAERSILTTEGRGEVRTLYGAPRGGEVVGNAAFQGPALLARHPQGLLVLDQTLWHARLRLVSNPLAPYGPIAYAVPSRDATELYGFDASGTHHVTVDALTGALRWRFETNEGALVRATDAYGLVTTVERNASKDALVLLRGPYGQEARLEMDAEGRLARVTDAANATTGMTYAAGLLARFVDPLGNPATFEYDDVGRLTKDVGPDGASFSLARRETARYFDVTMTTAEGRASVYTVERMAGSVSVRTRTLEPDGSLTVVENAGLQPDAPIRVALPDGSTLTAELAADPRWGESAPYVANATLKTPNGRERTQTMRIVAELHAVDAPLALRRLVTETSMDNGTWSVAYEADARRLVETSPEGRTRTVELDETGAPLRITGVGMPELRYERDERGRVVDASVLATGGTRTTTQTYDERGHLATVTDPIGRMTRFTRDAAGRILALELPGDRTIRAEYDTEGRVTKLAPPGRGEHSFTYTSAGLLEGIRGPMGAASAFAYTADRQILEAREGDDVADVYRYDEAGRPTSIDTADGRYMIEYGDDGLVSSLSGGGRIAVSLVHDGPFLLEERWSGAIDGSVTYELDETGRRTAVKVKDAPPILFAYDRDGILVRAGEVDVARDAASGAPTGVEVGEIRTTSEYDELGLLARERTLGPSGNVLYELSLARDEIGRIVRKVEQAEGTTRTLAYSYDEAGRLARVERDGVAVEEYRYDANGNRVFARNTQGTAEAEFDAEDRIVRAGDTRFEHSPRGEVLRRDAPEGVTAYNYTSDGLLRRTTLPTGATISHDHDVMGRRVVTTGPDKERTTLLYDGDLRPIGQLDEEGRVVATFHYATRLNVPDAMVKDGRTYRLVTDQLGSVRLVVDAATGEVAQRMEHDAYGVVLEDTRPGFQPFGFAGGLYDARAKSVAFGVREYAPHLARFLSRDPVTPPAALTNPYAYANGDPVDLVDPDGRLAAVIPIVFGGIVGGAGEIAGQLLSNGGEWGCIRWGRVANAAFWGGLQAGLLVTGPLTFAYAISVGAATSAGQYVTNTGFYGDMPTWGDLGRAAAGGAIGGAVGGPANPGKGLPYTTNPVHRAFSGTQVDVVGETLNQQSRNTANLGARQIASDAVGNTVGAVDPGQLGDTWGLW